MNSDATILETGRAAANGATPVRAQRRLPTPLLKVEDLHVEFDTSAGTVTAVEGVSFHVNPGEVLAIVGESGSGKSVSALAIMRLLPKRNGRVSRGSITFEDKDLLTLPEEQMRDLRGNRVSMIFQEPMTSLNPMLTIGMQITEPLIVHKSMDGAAAKARAIELLNMVGITDPENRLKQYPHEFSGGMRQRVMIAIGLACDPDLIIADEPTTALDVTIQAQILELMKKLTEEMGIALILITHNLGVVAKYADRVAVMYAGRLAEAAPATRIFAQPCHPYALGLLCSVPRLDRPRDPRLQTIPGLPPNLAKPIAGCRFAPRCPFRMEICSTEPPVVETQGGGFAACHRAEELKVERPTWDLDLSGLPATPVAPAAPGTSRETPLIRFDKVSRSFGAVRAVDRVSFELYPGETLGIVGESGSGKSTVGRILLGLTKPDEGDISIGGIDLASASRSQMRSIRKRLQVVFQDPYSSLNPRMRIGAILAEPIKYYGLVGAKKAREARVHELLELVGLPAHFAERYPHQLSGGQRQRVGIARAIAVEPECIVCDEAVSALDVSIQGQIINLLEDLRDRLGIGYFFIAHDLAVVRHISHRVAVMYKGRFVEQAPRDLLYANPRHPYTRALLEAVPIPDPAAEQARALRLAAVEEERRRSGVAIDSPRPGFTHDVRDAEMIEIEPGHFVTPFPGMTMGEA